MTDPARSDRRMGRGLVAAMLCALAFLGCSGEPERPPGRVLLIGIDGASPRVAFPMMAEGKLPNLARISERGVHGPLRSLLPLYSPRIWNTIATSRTPEDHGILAFVKKTDDDQKRLYLSHDRQVPAIWNILSQAGYSVGIVNWWTTYPPERIDGVMVSDHFFPEQIDMIKRTFKDEGDSSGPLVYPESWRARADALLAQGGVDSKIKNPFAEKGELPHWVNAEVLSRQFETDAEVTRVALGLQAEHHPDFMAVFLPGIDRISHWLWGNLEPAIKYPSPLRPSPSERKAGADALLLYYEFTDELIGMLTAGYGPDDLILIISDHGFEAGVSLMLLTGEHDSPAALDGVVFASGHGIAPGSTAQGEEVVDMAPSVLAWMGLPVADDMVGKPARFLALTDYATTESYDGLEIERLSDTASGREEQIVEHLRALGYLEESPTEEGPEPAADPDAAPPADER